MVIAVVTVVLTVLTLDVVNAVVVGVLAVGADAVVPVVITDVFTVDVDSVVDVVEAVVPSATNTDIQHSSRYCTVACVDMTSILQQ